MPVPDTNYSTLEKIKIKIRRITRNASSAQLSDSEIENYVNTFILYDMPANIKLDSLTEVITFFTVPNVDTYDTNTTDTDHPLYNFKNKYTNVREPVYIAGIRASYYQSVEEFHNIYPASNGKVSIGTGDGLITNFTGTLSDAPVLPSQVTVSSKDTVGNALLAYDDGEGGFIGDASALSTFNYSTSQYYVSFTAAPAAGEDIWMQTVAYTAGKPNSLLFFNDKFTIKPVPDIAYRIEILAYKRPTQMLVNSQLPELSEWWEYIALGAGIKVLQDRLDMETVALLMPIFKQQEILIGRRKIMQNSEKRSVTIYSGGLSEKY